MRAAVLSLSASLALVGLPAFADPCDPRPNALVADLGLHVINAGFQRTVGCHTVLQSSAGLYVPWTVNDNVLGLGGGDHTPGGDVAGLVLRVRAFFFPLGAAPAGLWVSPYAQAGVVRATVATEKVFGAGWAVGASAGWTFALGSRVLLGLGLGLQLHSAVLRGSTEFPGFARLGPTVDINVGYRF